MIILHEGVGTFKDTHGVGYGTYCKNAILHPMKTMRARRVGDKNWVNDKYNGSLASATAGQFTSDGAKSQFKYRGDAYKKEFGIK